MNRNVESAFKQSGFQLSIDGENSFVIILKNTIREYVNISEN